MKALVQSKYGAPEKVLSIREVAKPVPGDNEVLVKVHYSAVNDWDWSMVTGDPKIYRLMLGLRKPRNPIPGMELSGMVEALGPNSSKFNVGDAVYGDSSGHNTFGSYAQYMAVHEEDLSLKPVSMSFPDAASISHASMLAYQALEDVVGMKEGEKVLINGAGGGVGTIGLQLAKLKGAEVTGVDTGQKLKNMEELGFDHILDYKKNDFTREGKQYDIILDAKSTRSPRALNRALSDKGRYVTVGGQTGKFARVFLANILGNKKMNLLALKPNKDLDRINELYEQGKIKPIIDQPFRFEDAPKAVQYFGDARHSGKVLIAINP